MKNYHCCATCEHYAVIKKASRTNTLCKRLGFDTKPRYQFNCWSPKEHIRKIMERDSLS